MIKRESVDIGGYTYDCGMLACEEGLDVFAALAKPYGRVIERIGDAGIDTSEAGMAKLVGQILQELDGATLKLLCNAFKRQCLVSGGELSGQRDLSDIYAVHFSGRYMHLLKWVGFNCKLNFKDFFGNLGVIFGGTPSAAVTSNSPSVPTP